MKAVIFLRGWRVGEVELEWPEDHPVNKLPLQTNDTAILAIVNDPAPGDPGPLFLSGRLEAT